MIEYRNRFQFAAPRHTGGEWFVKAVRLAGLGSAWADQIYEPFPEKHNDLLRVSLVRHPVDWLLNHWVVGVDGNHVGEFASIPTDSSFREFLCQCLEHPGAVGRLFQQYEADSVIRFEDLPLAFVELARMMGVDERLIGSSFFSRPPIEQIMERGDCRGTSSLESIPGWLRREVCNSEKWLLDTYDYW